MTTPRAILLAAALAGSLALGFLAPEQKGHEGGFGHQVFYAVFGFVGCAVLVYVSKWIGKAALERPPDYYEPYRAPEPGEPR